MAKGCFQMKKSCAKSKKSGLFYKKSMLLEQVNIENVYLFCKDLPANPCLEIAVGGLCPPLNDKPQS